MDNHLADALVHQIVDDWRSAVLTAGDRSLCEFGAKLTLAPAQIVETDLDDLRRHGFEDRAVHDATQVVGYFNYITRVAEALGVEPEDFIPLWGSSKQGKPSAADG